MKTKVEATLQATIDGGRKGAVSGSKATGSKRTFDEMQVNEKELKGKHKNKRQEGWQQRQCAKTINHKFETIQKIRTAVAETGHGETEIPHEFWVALMRKEYS